MPLHLGLDIGTSATKAVVVDEEGRTVGSASVEYSLSQPRPGWSEQHPEEWWRAVCGACRSLAARVDLGEVAAVGLSGQMHGSVFVDEDALRSGGRDGRVLRPALLWNDQRTGMECVEIERAVGGRRRLVELVGNAALAGFTLPKILWVRQHEPAVFGCAARVMMPKDYVRWRLTGEVVTDVGDASGTLLFDPGRRMWSDEVARAVGVDLGLMPAVVESGEVAGRVTRWASVETGVQEGTPVVAGSGDNMMGAIGAGVVREGEVLVTLGTSGVVYAHVSRHSPDLPETGTVGRTHAMCAATGREGWCITGCMLSAAGALQWCRDALFPSTTFDVLLADAATVAPGAEGLVFLPHLMGERCPHPDPAARGAWVGLTSRHGRGHLVRALLEGVTYTLAEIVEIMRGQGLPPRVIRLGGGGTRSAFWRQMCADVFRAPVMMPSADEGPAFGGALLAGVGVGTWKTIEAACDVTIGIAEERDPEPTAADAYAEVRAIHRGLYAKLKETTTALSALAARWH